MAWLLAAGLVGCACAHGAEKAAPLPKLKGDSLVVPEAVRLTSGQRRQLEAAQAVLTRFIRESDPVIREGCARDFIANSAVLREIFANDAGFWRIRAIMAQEAKDHRAGREAITVLERIAPNEPRALELLARLRQQGWENPQGEKKTLVANFELRTLQLVMIAVPPGKFDMGDASADAAANTKPVTHVRITQGYWIGETEITNEQWRIIMGRRPDDFAENTLPKVSVAWEDAMEFCRRLTEYERARGNLPSGYEYSLPTEAQWEYACQASGHREYQDGLEEYAWFAANSGGEPHPVRSKKPNVWNIYNMLGNVSEWCLDWHADTLPVGEQVNPTGPSSGTLRVVRGGNFSSTAVNCRPSRRGSAHPDGQGTPLDKIGFRIVLSSVNSSQP